MSGEIQAIMSMTNIRMCIMRFVVGSMVAFIALTGYSVLVEEFIMPKVFAGGPRAAYGQLAGFTTLPAAMLLGGAFGVLIGGCPKGTSFSVVCVLTSIVVGAASTVTFLRLWGESINQRGLSPDHLVVYVPIVVGGTALVAVAVTLVAVCLFRFIKLERNSADELLD